MILLNSLKKVSSKTSTREMLIVIWASVVLLSVFPVIGSGNDQVQETISRAQSLYTEGRLGQAAKLLEDFLDSPNLDTHSVLEARRILAFVYASQLEFDEAKEQFRLILSLAPQFRLDEEKTPAVILKLFDYVRKKNPPVGLLQVKCQPQAFCFLDGRPTWYTPAVFENLPIGSQHVIDLRADGHRNKRVTLTVTTDSDTVWHEFRLEPLIEQPSTDIMGLISLVTGVGLGIGTILSYNDAERSYANYQMAITVATAQKYRSDTERKTKRTFYLGGASTVVLLFSTYRLWRGNHPIQQSAGRIKSDRLIGFDPGRKMILYLHAF